MELDLEAQIGAFVIATVSSAHTEPEMRADQGESDLGGPKNFGPWALPSGQFPWIGANNNYSCTQTAMIQQWRSMFKIPNAFFAAVQLSTWVSRSARGDKGGREAMQPQLLAELRDQQLVSGAKLQNFALVTNADYGAGGNIHPPYKQHVGERLANAAMAIVYNQHINWRSPTFKSATAGTKLGEMTIALNDVEAAGLTLKPAFNAHTATVGTHSDNCTALNAITPGTCAWASIQFDDAKKSWVNATVGLTSDKKSITLTAPPPVGASSPIATSMGWGSIPMMVVYRADMQGEDGQLPVLPWNRTVELRNSRTFTPARRSQIYFNEHSQVATGGPPPPLSTFLTPRLHWATSLMAKQGDPSAPLKLGSTWHIFVDCLHGWCHATSQDGGVSWNETVPLTTLNNQSYKNGVRCSIGTGSWAVLPNGTALGLYCAKGSGLGANCGEFNCIGVMTSDDKNLASIDDHGVRFRAPANLSGMRDPARPFLSKDGARMCTVLGAGARDCAEGGNKWVQYCTPDLTRVNEWHYVSTLASEFANRGCDGLVSCPDFFPLDDKLWMLIGNYNTQRSAWYPPSRWSIGRFTGTTYTATSGGILGGDSDYVPKSGADESNTGRRLLWSNIGSTPGGHDGYLSLSRELSLSAALNDTHRLGMRFIPELAALRRVRLAVEADGADAMQRVGDTSLHSATGSYQMELRLTVPRASASLGSSDTFGLAVMSSVSPHGAGRLAETTRIGYSPFMRQLTIDRQHSSSNPKARGWPSASSHTAGTPTAAALLSYPFELPPGEDLALTVIVDGFLLEVCANNQTIVAAMALPSQSNSTRFGFFGLKATTEIHMDVWDLKSLY